MTYLSANAEVANNARAAIESISFFIISLLLVSLVNIYILIIKSGYKHIQT